MKSNIDIVECIKRNVYQGEYNNEHDLEEDHCIKVKKLKIWKKVS